MPIQMTIQTFIQAIYAVAKTLFNISKIGMNQAPQSNANSQYQTWSKPLFDHVFSPC